MLIRDKIIFLFSSLVTLILCLFSVFVFYFFSLHREQAFYNRLLGKAQVSQNILISRKYLNDVFFKAISKIDLLTIVDEQISFFDKEKKLIYSNKDSIDTPYFQNIISELKQNKVTRFKHGKNEGAGLIFIDRDKNQYFVFASGYDELGFSNLERLKFILLIGNLAGFLLTLFSGAYFSSLFLKPLSVMVERVNKITGNNISARIDEGNKKDEVAKLAITFNAMLDRLKHSLDNQKYFVSTASHQLRTPLANMLGTLETSLIYDTEISETKISMESSIEEIKYLIELTNNLLSIAKTDINSITLKKCYLDVILLNVQNLISKKHQQRKLIINNTTEEIEKEIDYTVFGNESLLITAFYNLVDNAFKYSSEDVIMTVALRSGEFLVDIIDAGRGIPENNIKFIFETMYRANNTSDIQGHGIGLSIAEKIIVLHKGKIEIKNNIKIPGVSVFVMLPVNSNS
jgi:signal transduction histidine kinase